MEHRTNHRAVDGSGTCDATAQFSICAREAITKGRSEQSSELRAVRQLNGRSSAGGSWVQHRNNAYSLKRCFSHRFFHVPRALLLCIQTVDRFLSKDNVVTDMQPS